MYSLENWTTQHSLKKCYAFRSLDSYSRGFLFLEYAFRYLHFTLLTTYQFFRMCQKFNLRNVTLYSVPKQSSVSVSPIILCFYHFDSICSAFYWLFVHMSSLLDCSLFKGLGFYHIHLFILTSRTS